MRKTREAGERMGGFPSLPHLRAPYFRSLFSLLIFAPYFLLIFLLMSAAYSSLAERCCFSLQGKALQAAARSKEKQNDLIVGNVSSDSQLENERMF